MFTTRVERNFEAAHTNGPPEGRCATMHGHSWQVVIEVTMSDSGLDEYGWSVDFTELKRLIDRYDHQTLNTLSGLEKPSAEHIAMQLWYDTMALQPGVFWDCTVKISEGHGNTLIYHGPDTAGFEPSPSRGCSNENCTCE